jgi:outer membrane protein OmpA-like peptidoglycan-associated protein
MKKSFILLIPIAIITLLPSCGGKQSKKAVAEPKKVAHNTDAFSSVHIPLADNQATMEATDENIQSFFDQDIDEFVALAQDENVNKESTLQGDIQGDDYAWIEANEQSFKKVYFDFDQKEVRPDQQVSLDYDIEQAKKLVETEQKAGRKPTVIVEGHACHSAGSGAYNLALSEDRAKKVVDYFRAQGIDVKVVAVGRGKEVPAVINGKTVTGSREEQWPNRRVEIRVITDATTAS